MVRGEAQTASGKAGTMTAYDPYQPLKLGAAIQLYRRERQHHASDIDPVELTRAPTERAHPSRRAPRA